jgi:hypothetical protein
MKHHAFNETFDIIALTITTKAPTSIIQQWWSHAGLSLQILMFREKYDRKIS